MAATAPKTAKYIFVTGGVTSSLGKGIIASSLAHPVGCVLTALFRRRGCEDTAHGAETRSRAGYELLGLLSKKPNQNGPAFQRVRLMRMPKPQNHLIR